MIECVHIRVVDCKACQAPSLKWCPQCELSTAGVGHEATVSVAEPPQDSAPERFKHNAQIRGLGFRHADVLECFPSQPDQAACPRSELTRLCQHSNSATPQAPTHTVPSWYVGSVAHVLVCGRIYRRKLSGKLAPAQDVVCVVWCSPSKPPQQLMV